MGFYSRISCLGNRVKKSEDSFSEEKDSGAEDSNSSDSCIRPCSRKGLRVVSDTTQSYSNNPLSTMEDAEDYSDIAMKTADASSQGVTAPVPSTAAAAASMAALVKPLEGVSTARYYLVVNSHVSSVS